MEPIPLFRNLMRQASVFYDDMTRNYLTRYIKLRFRVNKDLSDHSRIRKLLKEGRRGLSVLTRANSGDLKPLQRVLEMGYGRVGRRKHELLRGVIAPQPNEQPNEPPNLLVPGDPRTLCPVITDQFMALMKAQTRKTINKAEPVIPEQNIWGKPIAKCREVNLRRRHYASVLRRILPPVPSETLERLERLARGEEHPIPPKRKIISRAAPKAVGHRLTLRYKRRMWRKILALSPVLNFDTEKLNWCVYWSRLVDGPPKRVGELADFEGLTRAQSAGSVKIKKTSKKITDMEKSN